MGTRIYVAKIYQVEHSTTEGFGNRQEAINRLLFDECSELSWMGEDIEASEHLEIPRSELGSLIAKIASNRDHYDKWLKEHDIDVSVDNFIVTIATWISQSDPRNDFVVLSWY